MKIDLHFVKRINRGDNLHLAYHLDKLIMTSTHLKPLI